MCYHIQLQFPKKNTHFQNLKTRYPYESSSSQYKNTETTVSRERTSSLFWKADHKIFQSILYQ